MSTARPDLIVLHEHPEWQKPLFAALARRGVAFEPFDVTRAAFADSDAPQTTDGRRVFYDINANSNLRPAVAGAFGFDPFERVVDYLVAQLEVQR